MYPQHANEYLFNLTDNLIIEFDDTSLDEKWKIIDTLTISC